MSLSHDDHSSLSGKLKVGCCPPYEDLTKEDTRWIPYMDAIAAARIDIALRVTVDSYIRTRSARLSVSDDGRGLPSAIRLVICAKIFRLSNVPSLATVYRYLQNPKFWLT